MRCAITVTRINGKIQAFLSFTRLTDSANSLGSKTASAVFDDLPSAWSVSDSLGEARKEMCHTDALSQRNDPRSDARRDARDKKRKGLLYAGSVQTFSILVSVESEIAGPLLDTIKALPRWPSID